MDAGPWAGFSRDSLPETLLCHFIQENLRYLEMVYTCSHMFLPPYATCGTSWGMAFPTAGALRQDRYRSLLSEKAGYDVWNDKARCGTTDGGETRAAKLRDSSKIELYNMIIFIYICVCVVLAHLYMMYILNIIMIQYGLIWLNIRYFKRILQYIYTHIYTYIYIDIQ